MTSTPVSLDESLSGSWIDINSASQIPSPTIDNSPEFPRQHISMTKSVQNIGLLPFQVERFLQEAQRAGNTNDNSGFSRAGQQANDFDHALDDNNSGIYESTESESGSIDHIDGKAILDSLRQFQRIQNQRKESNNNGPDFLPNELHDDCSNYSNIRLVKSFDCSIDQLSDSLSMLSRASKHRPRSTGANDTTSLQDFDWLWDWTDQPEYFSGQEWKVNAPRREYLIRQQQFYRDHLQDRHSHSDDPNSDPFSGGDFISLLFLTNMLSIIIGAGLTYSILARRSTV